MVEGWAPRVSNRTRRPDPTPPLVPPPRDNEQTFGLVRNLTEDAHQQLPVANHRFRRDCDENALRLTQLRVDVLLALRNARS